MRWLYARLITELRSLTQNRTNKYSVRTTFGRSWDRLLPNPFIHLRIFKMFIIPVVDLKNGQVVHGIAGQRDQYQPVQSVLTSSSKPLDVICAFEKHFRFQNTYLADLDAIEGGPPAYSLYQAIQDQGTRLWVDAGIHNLTDARNLIQCGVAQVITGLETLSDASILGELVAEVGPDQLVFSLDLKSGKPMGASTGWKSRTVHGMVEQAVDLGIRKLIVLDLSRVGVDQGTGTLDLCRWIKNHFPDLVLVSGGGIRDITDLQALSKTGLEAALVASALHDGRIGTADLALI